MIEPVIISLSGRKGAGKNAVADYVREYLSDSSCLFRFGSMNEIKEYAFADLLKEFCMNVLGLDKSQCYGSNNEKNTPTKYKWKDTLRFKDVVPKMEWYMTGRDVMQVFGTECVRDWFGNVWADATIRKIRKAHPKIAIITDTRFVSEVDAVLDQPHGYIIRLTRSPFGDEHVSETALDDCNWDRERCFVLDNADISIEEQNNRIGPILGQIFSECNL